MESFQIPLESQRRLINLARRALESFVSGLEHLVECVDDPYLLLSDHGAFVSLHKNDQLRGCIGTCFPTRPLYQTVIEMTKAAASRDHRVPPVRQSELIHVLIGVSVLSPLQLVRDPSLLEPGKHGLYVVSGNKRAALLPQVATQYHWDMKTFLSQVCLKADLCENAWESPETQISSFTALIIEEER
ncbi:MAG: AmmeMemoRadiSam system protein A [Deltaproteobacteria bacterium]|nr:AmmeMemoRadiSam system protein A [Deltaproteobacteria bacterium]